MRPQLVGHLFACQNNLTQKLCAFKICTSAVILCHTHTLTHTLTREQAGKVCGWSWAGTAGAESGTHKFHLLVAIVVVTLASADTCCCCCRYCLRSCLNNGHTTCPTAWLPLPQRLRLRLLHVAIGFSIIGQFNGCPNQTEMNPANQTAHTDKFPLLFAEVLMSVCPSVSLSPCVCV